MIINGAMAVSFRWTENKHYVLVVEQETLVVQVKRFITRFVREFLKNAICFPNLKKVRSLSVSSLLLKMAFLETIGSF